MKLFEKTVSVPRAPGNKNLIAQIESTLAFRLADGEIPIRLAVTSIDENTYNCEIDCISNPDRPELRPAQSIFAYTQRGGVRADQFVAAFIVPTGIGAEVGGHAGDATPAARLLAACCDQLVTHPNVVNASDVNEIPENALYVEGSVVCRLLMGTVGLRPTRANRVLVAFDGQDDPLIENLTVNTVEAARATYGLNCVGLYRMDPPLQLAAGYSESGRAVGTGSGIDRLLNLLIEKRTEFDAVAISSMIDVPAHFHEKYFDSGGTMVNPWGGVEAMLTHAVSQFLDVPSAHAPMVEMRDVLFADPGRVDPRIAAEAVSSSFFQCVLKGLNHSPAIVSDPAIRAERDVLNADDVACLVTPDGCIGLPVLAALEQGIPVIAVREGAGFPANDLSQLPWAPGQLTVVENYWEAAGVLSAFRAGLSPASVRRPFAKLEIETWSNQVAQATDQQRRPG